MIYPPAKPIGASTFFGSCPSFLAVVDLVVEMEPSV